MARRTRPAAQRAWRRVAGEWALLGFAVLVAVGTGAFMVVLGDRADDARRAQAHISHVHAAAERQAGLEWEVVATGALDAALGARLDDVRRELDGHLADLAGTGVPVEDVRAVERLVRAYEGAVDDEFVAMTAGRYAQAQEIDETRVDPGFDALTGELEALSDRAGVTAESSVASARSGTLAGLGACVLIAGLLLWRFQRSRRDRALHDRESALLRTSEARFRSLVQNSRDVITVVNPDGVIMDQSAPVERVLGYPVGALTGTSILDVTHPADTAALAGAIQRAEKHPGQPVTVELRMRGRDGDWRDTETAVTDLTGDAGVGGIVLTTTDIGERKELQEQLTHQAFHDSLTGLANRVLFTDRVEHALTRRGDGEHIAVLFVDLDDFKTVNDSLGHAAGDAVLMAAAGRLGQIVRPADTVARLGGDEFAVLLEGITGPADAEGLAARLIAALEAPVPVAGHDLRARASVGIALDEGAATTEEVLRNADVAMYAAKAAGKGRFAVFAPEMHSQLVERIELIAELRGAITNGELRCLYQPIVDLADTSIVGVEALVRWEHPRRGLVSPAQFIPLAEETGLIVPLGRWVLNTACAQMGAWHAEAGPAGRLRLSVNLSERQLHDVRLVADVEDALAKSGLDPGCLVLELTESTLIEERGDTIARLHALKALGVRLAVDDFGVGYSSLRYLHRLPVDELKVDKSFVDNVHQGPEQAALAEAIIALGHRLSLDTVAEGIETPDQVDALRSLGCALGQGYRFATPLAPEVMGRLLADARDGVAVWPDAPRAGAAL